MRFWVETRLVGSVDDVDRLAQAQGYDKEEVTLLTDSQDAKIFHEFFGKQGRAAGVTDLGGFFLVARDGDYTALWGFSGTIPYVYKDLYEVVWRWIDEREYNVLKTRFARYPKGECPNCKQDAIDHTATKDGLRCLVECPKGEEVDHGEAIGIG